MTNRTHRAYARHSDPDTSHKAAEALTEAKINRLETLALHALARLGGEATTGEIVEETGCTWQTMSPRFAPLKRRDLLKVVGKRNGQQVLALTDSGMYAATLAMLAEAKTIGEWNASGRFPYQVYDPDGFDRSDPKLMDRRFTADEFERGAMRSTCMAHSSAYADAAPAPSITPESVDAITNEEWNEILSGQMQMKGWMRKRMKRAIRLLVNGNIGEE